MDVFHQVIVINDKIQISDVIRFHLESNFCFEIVPILSPTSQAQYDLNKVGLIVCDHKMSPGYLPNINKRIIEKKLTIPFFITGQSKEVDSPLYAGFDPLEKLSIHSLLEDFESSIPKYFQKNEEYVPGPYTPISIDTLKSIDGVEYDIFIQLSSGRLLKLFRKGDNITEEDIEKYMNKGVSKLYIERETSQWILKHLKKNWREFLEKIEIKAEREGKNKNAPYDFVPIRTRTLLEEKPVPFQCFQSAESDSTILIRPGTVMTPERLGQLKEDNIIRMFILAKEEPLYQDYLNSFIDEILQSKQSNVEDKASAIAHNSKTVLKENYENFNDKSLGHFEKLAKSIGIFIENTSIEGLRSIMKIENDMEGYTEVLKISTLASTLLQTILKLNEDPDQQKLVRPLVSQISDLEAANKLILIPSLLSKLGEKLTDDPLEAPKITSELIGHHGKGLLYQKMAEIVVQIKEQCDGSGIPLGLKKANIGVYPQIINLSMHLIDQMYNQGLSEEDALSYLDEHSHLFNPILLEVIRFVPELKI